MAGVSITFRSRGAKTVSRDIAKAMEEAVGEKIDDAIQKGMSAAVAEVQNTVGDALRDKSFRGFTSVTGNLLEGMGVVIGKIDPKSGVVRAAKVRGFMNYIGYGPALRNALGKGERFWLDEWGTSPRSPKYHDRTPVGRIKKKKGKGYRYLPYRGETDVDPDTRGYMEREDYARQILQMSRDYKYTRLVMTVFSSMPYTKFADQKKGYNFMENIHSLLKNNGTLMFAKHFTL